MTSSTKLKTEYYKGYSLICSRSGFGSLVEVYNNANISLEDFLGVNKSEALDQAKSYIDNLN